MKDEVVGINHLLQVIQLLKKSANLLAQGKDVYPYSKWRDKLSELSDEISEEIIEVEKIKGI